MAALTIKDRAGSFDSSSTRSPTMYEANEKLAQFHDDEEKLISPDELEAGFNDDDEDRTLLGQTPQGDQSPSPPTQTSFTTAILWMVANTLATIGIVFTNKAIFSDPSLKLAQLSFAAFHFTITFLTLFTLSRGPFALFVPRRASVREILPLSLAMALNVILPNLSLAYSTITFYQVARILLTPTVALMNYVLYRSTLPRTAIAALVPACLGVAMVTYYDTLPSTTASTTTSTTHPLGVLFAFSGIFASSLYTVWIASFHRKLGMSSMQLLLNQAPVATLLLLYAIPFVDTFPVWAEVAAPRWAMVALSGAFASLINISQFFIIAQTGPVSSTVVGHVKTCTIVGLGWVASGKAVGDRGALGVAVAVGGIIWYSMVMLRERGAEKK
ncbi:triose-phosphate transporter [Schizothecium vesticola]|uniref:GDP-mannose transporter n=1 Tax=Schizothecium vesticola TaxID=314040 RepID=A0AA40F8R1_9PEZI|nr:triose-phosphate transporter [Schizothecium vesticola]